MMATLYDYKKVDKIYILTTKCRVLSAEFGVLNAEYWLLQAKSVRGY